MDEQRKFSKIVSFLYSKPWNLEKKKLCIVSYQGMNNATPDFIKIFNGGLHVLDELKCNDPRRSLNLV